MFTNLPFNQFDFAITSKMLASPGSPAAGACLVALFTGTPPAISAVLTADSVTMNQFATWANANGGAMMWSCGYTSCPMWMDGKEAVIDFAGATYTAATTTMAGTPTWAVIFPACDSTPAVTDSISSAFMLATVGDENSSADIKIKGGSLAAGQSFTMNTVRINFDGMGV